MIIAGTIDNILMVEGEMGEVSEHDMIAAIKEGHEAIKDQCQVQMELTEEAGKTEKRTYSHEDSDEDLKNELHQTYYDQFYQVAQQQIANKAERKGSF